MKHLVLHVGEHTHSIKQKLRTIPAPDVHNPVPFLFVSAHSNLGLLTPLLLLTVSVSDMARTAPLVVPVGIHHLVEPPLGVVAPGAEAPQPQPHSLFFPVPITGLHYVPQLGLDLGQTFCVNGPKFLCVLQVDYAGHPVVVGPGRGGGDVEAQAQ